METIKYKGYTINIIQEEDACNPRKVFEDNYNDMICFHNRYDLGDEHSYTKEELIDMVESGKYIYLPLYLYDHSGITMNTTGFSCQWDSGQVGFIIADKEEVKKEFGWKKLTAERIEKIKSYLKDEVQAYDHYLQGNIYGYSVKNDEGEELDSSWGYYGYNHEKNGLMDDAESFIDSEIEEIQIKEGVQTSLFDPQV